MRLARRVLATVAGLLSATSSLTAAEKDQYSLFHPTPDRLLREMTTDRPDITESPFTVDAGRVQIETTLFGYARSDAGGTTTDTYEVATTNLRIGLTSNVELGVGWQPYGVVRTRMISRPSSMRQSGIGGLDIRGKINLWGNDTFDKTGTALALLPFITLPTDRHNGVSPEFVEGGLIVPYAIKLSDKLGFGVNAGAVFVRDSGASGYHAEYLSSASFAYEWNERLGTYYEIASRFGGSGGDIVLLGTGLTYKLRENLLLNAGVNVGVTSAADRLNPFVGLSRRF